MPPRGKHTVRATCTCSVNVPGTSASHQAGRAAGRPFGTRGVRKTVSGADVELRTGRLPGGRRRVPPATPGEWMGLTGCQAESWLTGLVGGWGDGIGRVVNSAISMISAMTASGANAKRSPAM